MYALFKEFDHVDINFLTLINIKVAMRRMGKLMELTEIEGMLKEHNIEKDGGINFE